jgi:hypothetical protein
MTVTRALGRALLLMLPLCAAALPVAAQVHRDLEQFMRQKLELSQGVLAGLAREDYALIAKNARALKALSEDAQWRVSPNINYLRLSSDFQAQADDMARMADARNLDGAALAYVQMTIGCVNCHRLIRNQSLVSLNPARR